jgi:hypothetical protein
MEYDGDYFYAEIDQYCRNFEPLMVLLDHDYKEDGLNLRLYIDRSTNKSLYDYRIKLVGRHLGINIILPSLYRRLSQLHLLRTKRYLIEYKEYLYVVYRPDKEEYIDVRQEDISNDSK